MSDARSASIVISSYNYGRFLNAAIDSALHQTHPDTEVIVVDDGSTDGSREIIAAYGEKIIPVLKENGGQASALNAGFRSSRGDVVLFLDSDDMLLPTAVERALELFRGQDVAKVHWDLWIADPDGRTRTETVRPSLPEGDLRDAVMRAGADGYTWPPTSGNAWARRFLERALPIPEAEFRTCPDFYLETLAPLYGRIGKVTEPQGFWRSHPSNASFRDPFDENLGGGLRRAERCLTALEEHCRALGVDVDPRALRASSRWHQMKRATEQIEALIPREDAFILVDQDHWCTGELVLGRRRFLFPERSGQFWGLPADDESAIQELTRLRAAGARFIVFVWPYLWWLDHYALFHRHLRSSYRAAMEDDRIVVFDLRAPSL